MPSIAAPPNLQSADNPLRELATLFATGILRLRSRPGIVTELSPKLSQSTAQGLEFQAPRRLSVHSG